MSDIDAAYQEHKKWSSEHGYEPLSRDVYEKVREVKIKMMEGMLEGYRMLSRPGVTFSDDQKQAIQERIQKEQD